MGAVHIPDKQPTLTSETLVLRPWTMDDAQELALMCDEENVARFTSVRANYTLEMAEEFIRKASEEYSKETIDYCIENTDGNIVGSISLLRFSLSDFRVEIGYLMSSKHRGKGIITEATKILTQAAHDWGFDRVELFAAVENIASNKVAQKAGFEFEGTLRKRSVVKDQVQDVNVYAHFLD